MNITYKPHSFFSLLCALVATSIVNSNKQPKQGPIGPTGATGLTGAIGSTGATGSLGASFTQDTTHTLSFAFDPPLTSVGSIIPFVTQSYNYGKPPSLPN